jgi:hypothetical protein
MRGAANGIVADPRDKLEDDGVGEGEDDGGEGDE